MAKQANATQTNLHRYAVIMAGGSGTRLWPMSRRDRPKQFQSLVDSKTMIQTMFGLINKVVPADHIYVQADARFKELITEQLRDLPANNILIEPEARDNGPAFAFATAHLLKRDQEADICVLWADHLIKQSEKFVAAINTAFRAVEDLPSYIVSVGVKPTYPHTGLGYIKIKQEIKTYPSGTVFLIDKFIEKPVFARAKKFAQSWEYFWNTGYTIYNGREFLKNLNELDPDNGAIFANIVELVAKNATDADVAAEYIKLPKVSIDTLVKEKMVKSLVVPSDMEWSDIGDWKTLHDMMAKITGKDIVSRNQHVEVGCENCLVYAQDKMIATIGLKDIAVIDTGDVILVVNKESSQQVKQMVAKLESENKHEYL